MKKLAVCRILALVVFSVGIAFSIYATTKELNLNILVSGWFAFTGLGAFIYTEAFLFKEPSRSKSAILTARIFLAIVVFVVSGITINLLTGNY